MKNRIGNIFSLTSFGESHGPAMGGVIDGMPAGVPINLDDIQFFVNRRRPGQSSITSARAEADRVHVLSGVFEGVTLGTPIGFVVYNEDQHSSDYDALKDCYRPSHADFTYEAKFGRRDHRGGGRASARETVSRVVAGAFAMQALNRMGITIRSKVIEAAGLPEPSPWYMEELTEIIEDARRKGDTIGGRIRCIIHGVPAGLGEPVFDKLSAQLAYAMMSIPAAKAFEMGIGRDFARKMGSQVIDQFATADDGSITTLTNHSAGIQGGISNGQEINFTVTFKPVATLMRPLPTVDRQGNPVTLQPTGRHDVCVVPRAVPIVEAMAAIVLLDNVLMNRASQI